MHVSRNYTLPWINFFFVCIWLFTATNSYAAGPEADTADIPAVSNSKGPLLGKNLFIPFLLHYNFPSLPASSGERYDLQYHLSLYYTNDVDYADNDGSWHKVKRDYIRGNIARDYESLAVELGLAYNFLKQLQVGIDMRMYSYYGGFLDIIIETFHGIFGFPNAGREFFLQNKLYINIPNDNGITMFLDQPAVSFGDIDLWGKWTFFENGRVSLGILGAFKLPTGRLAALSGSDYPDAAIGLLLDFRALQYITLFAQAGAVFPFNKSYTMFNGMAGLEFHPWKLWSIIAQMNFKTSPISNSEWNSAHGAYFRDYSLMQGNFLLGAVYRNRNFRLQFYLEEDAINHQGTDITFNITFSRTINLK